MARAMRVLPDKVSACGPFVLAVLVALGACGSEAPPGEQSPVPPCRRFATQTREVRTGTPAAGETMTTCSFDSTQIALTCTTFDAGGNSSTSTVTRWASVEDAVAHDLPIGRSSAQRVSSLRGPCTITQEYRYDAQARLTAIQSSVDTAACGGFSAVYDSWDSHKRPLTGTMTASAHWPVVPARRSPATSTMPGGH